MVRKDITASQFSVRRKEIRAMPVTSVEQILTTKPGVVEGGHIRGGRAEETVYIDDLSRFLQNKCCMYLGITRASYQLLNHRQIVVRP